VTPVFDYCPGRKSFVHDGVVNPDLVHLR
jgi:hypothetical protein